jgi:hypothetical protein
MLFSLQATLEPTNALLSLSPAVVEQALQQGL